MRLAEKKKIMFVTLSLEGGGAEKIISRLILNLHSEIDIVLVTFYERGRYLSEVKSLPHITCRCINADKGNTMAFARRLRSIVKQEDPHKVITFLYYPNIIAFLSLLFLKIPLIASERSNHRHYLDSSLKHRIWRFLLGRTYRKAETVVAVSRKSAADIVEDFGIIPSKIKTIHNGISFEILDRLKEEPVTEFRFEEGVKYILAAGSLVRAKNYPLLIESFGIISEKRKNIRLLILGSGVLEKELRALSEKRGLKDTVCFLGYNENPYKFMKEASCYVLSSDWEGFPNSLLEAMYVNGHVVSTDCPAGPSEIITNGVDGLLCETGNPQLLAVAMEKMCFDEDFRIKVYKNSREKISGFGEEKMINEYRELLIR